MIFYTFVFVKKWSKYIHLYIFIFIYYIYNISGKKWNNSSASIENTLCVRHSEHLTCSIQSSRQCYEAFILIFYRWDKEAQKLKVKQLLNIRGWKLGSLIPLYWTHFRNLTLVGHRSTEGKIWLMSPQIQKFDQAKCLIVPTSPRHEDDLVHFLTVSKIVEQVQKDMCKKQIATHLLQDTSLGCRITFPS